MRRALLAAAAGALALAGCGWPARVEPEKAEPASLVDWIWSGAVTPDGATVNAKVGAGRTVRLLVSPREDLEAPIFSPPQRPDPARGDVVSFRVHGLRPATLYHYAVAAGDEIDFARRGRFRTFPPGPASFAVALASCATTGSDSRVWDAVRTLDPLLFLHLGDFHYEDVAEDDRLAYRLAYARALTAPRQARLYRWLPVAYVWDDHDFGGNNSDRGSPGRRAVRLTYQEIVPHYPLAAGRGDVPIYQSFRVGRVRFVLTDLRSERTPRTAADGPDKTAMGAAQKAWWKRELRAARDAGELVAWVSTNAWIGGADRRNDGWGAYATERRELAEFLAAEGIDDLVALSGDAHMLAIDDGTNSNYTRGPGPAFPVIHAAALDRRGSVKGGPYSEGVHPNRSGRNGYDGQFMLMTVRDPGGREICLDWSGKRLPYDGTDLVELVRWGKCFDLGPPPLSAPPAH
ncbi:MAG TPA: alkaline phosphatase D family protein [Thermoanaerobaculia bacterium]|nr:alkaline phosphatase D family protein [Thermoanaerobaculia bacterium]